MQKLLNLPQTRSLSKLLFILLVLIISYLAFIPSYDGLPEVVTVSGVINHFVAFLVLAFFLDHGYEVKVKNAFLLLFMYGLLIECVQYFLPNRVFELLDLVVDVSGILVFYVLKRGVSRR